MQTNTFTRLLGYNYNSKLNNASTGYNVEPVKAN